MNKAKLILQLNIDESRRNRPYLDCCGKYWRDCVCPSMNKGNLTIGVGRNLDANPLSDYEIDFLRDNDILRASQDLDSALPWWRKLDDDRQNVLVNMCFNLGLPRLLAFHHFLAYLQSSIGSTMSSTLLASAAAELTDSLWARQVGARATRLATTIKGGSLPYEF